MKKGISLIVLVITIIVMIIIAGAIIISLNSSNVINKSNEAVLKTDVATINDKLTLAYVDLRADNPTVDTYAADTKFEVGNTEYDNTKAYYEAVVEEVADRVGVTGDTLSGYKVVYYTNGSAWVVPTTETVTGAITYGE